MRSRKKQKTYSENTNKFIYGAMFIIALIIHSQFLMSFKSSSIESPNYVVIEKCTDFSVQKTDTLSVLKSK